MSEGKEPRKVVYHGVRAGDDCIVMVDGEMLCPRLDLADHSTDGFDWGHLGSGPAQLALALLAHHCGPDEQRAVDHHQEFKRRIISWIHMDEWQMTTEYVEERLRRIEQVIIDRMNNRKPHR